MATAGERGQAVSFVIEYARQGYTESQLRVMVAEFYPGESADWIGGVVRSGSGLARGGRRIPPPPPAPPQIVTVFGLQEVEDESPESKNRNREKKYISFSFDVNVNVSKAELNEELHWAGVDAARAAGTAPVSEPELIPPLMFHYPR